MIETDPIMQALTSLSFAGMTNNSPTVKIKSLFETDLEFTDCKSCAK